MSIPEKNEREQVWRHVESMSLEEKSKYFYKEVWPFVEIIDNADLKVTEKSELYFDMCPMSGTVSYTIRLKDETLSLLCTPFWDGSIDGIPIQITSEDEGDDVTEKILHNKEWWVLPFKLTGKPMVDAATYIHKVKSIVQAIFGGEL